MPALPKGPEGEQGTVAPHIGWGWNLGSAAGLTDITGTEREQADAWRWPTAVDTVDAMFNDSQVVALTSAIMLPAQFADVRIAANGMDPALAALLASDLDLPLEGQEPGEDESKGRRRDAFNHRKHFGRALSALGYGHACFEIVGEIKDGQWRLKNLAPRPSWSIQKFLVDKQGRLQRIETLGHGKNIELEVNRIALWTWGGDVGDVRGQSILRSLYRPWMLKDRGMRIDMIGHERNAMGIPIGWLPEGGTPADRDELVELLANIAAGEDSNLVLPHGSDVKFRGVEGTVSKVIDSVKFMNEEMARALLGMIVNLGQTATGSRAVGDNFMDLLGLFHRVVLDWYCDLLTEQVVEPWVNFNVGEDAPAARVVWSQHEEAEEAPAPEPVEEEETEEEESNVVPIAASRRRGSRLQRTAFASILPDRPLARDPFPHEVAAAVDFKTMDTQHVSAASDLVDELTDVRVAFGELAAEVVAGLGQEVIESPDKALLAEGALTTAMLEARAAQDLTKIAGSLEAVHAQGVAQVVAEAKGQGASVAATATSYAQAALGEAQDLLGRVARQVTDTALGAVRISGSEPGILASAISSAIDTMSTQLIDRAISGAVSRAQLTGRVDQMKETTPKEIYASELLDGNTCAACEDIDGKEYDSLEDALGDYPAGGYTDCEGGDQCRGTLVVVFESEGSDT